MSDTAIAIVVLPFLIVLTLALECTRIGCTWAARNYRTARAQSQNSAAKRQQPQP